MYGERPVKEEDSVSPGGAYGVMKYVNETMAQMYTKAYGLQIVRVRPPGILGAGNTMWPSRVITPPALGRPAKVAFPSGRRQNAVPVEDLAELYSRLALAPTVRHDLYNAPGHSFVSKQVADVVRKFIPDAQIEFDEKASLEAGFPYLYDNTRAATEFEWRVRSLEDSIHSHINGERIAAGLKPI
jgi:nucleoside-diphosphate-sugar epimerase